MEVRAIDVHVHLSDELTLKAMGQRASQMSRYFGRERQAVSIDELADQYRERQMMAVLMNSTDVTRSATPPVPNEHIADAVKRHPDVFIGFGVVDPWQGELAVQEVRKCAEELGLRGIGELNPGRQQFYPNDPRFHPLWSEAATHGMALLFHTGFMAAGARTPGGSGYKLEYTRPIPYLDDLAADFPELNIIGAHPSWPWQEESLAIARHKTNFYIDLSGWAPKYFSESLIKNANSIIPNQVLFGSDWPALSVERWLEEFEALPIKDEVRQKIMLDNARELLKLDHTLA